MNAEASNAPAPLPCNAPEATPRPRLVPADHGRALRFATALDHARAQVSPDAAIQPPRSMAQLMRMLMLIEMRGEPVPPWLSETLRAAGLEVLADTLEARDRRMQQERHAAV